MGGIYIYIENFKNLIVRNGPLVTLYQDCSSHFDTSKTIALRGAEIFFPFISIYRKL